jgi:predicted NBD/HSP70 family sugar kinase
MQDASPPDRSQTEATVLRGTNQSGMRDHNERLVLSLVRRHGALAKSDIARMTGLSAQTVSVIMRGLEEEGLLERGAPVRGKVGQPSIPMSLAAEGAFFFGLKVGRRSADLVLTDFRGRLRAARRKVYRYPTPDTVVGFVKEAAPALAGELPPALRGRIMGMGVAMPFQLWNWVSVLGIPQEEMDAWRARDIGAELGAVLGLPVYVQNDATSACGAELIFGTGERPKDFLYFYFGTFIGGGLVMNGQLFLGRTGNAAGVGSIQVPAPGGGTRRLIDLASMSVLAEAMEAAGEGSDHLWSQHDRWDVSEPVLSAWMTQRGGGAGPCHAGGGGAAGGAGGADRRLDAGRGPGRAGAADGGGPSAAGPCRDRPAGDPRGHGRGRCEGAGGGGDSLVAEVPDRPERRPARGVVSTVDIF